MAEAALSLSTQEAKELEVPYLKTPVERIRWMTRLFATGRWRRGMEEVIAPVWSCTVGSVRNYATQASRHVNVIANDQEQLIALCKVRLDDEAEQAEESKDRINANKVLLQSVGALAHAGRKDDKIFENEDDYAHAVQQLREPGADALRLLNAAFDNPGVGLKKWMERRGLKPMVDVQGEQV